MAVHIHISRDAAPRPRRDAPFNKAREAKLREVIAIAEKHIGNLPKDLAKLEGELRQAEKEYGGPNLNKTFGSGHTGKQMITEYKRQINNWKAEVKGWEGKKERAEAELKAAGLPTHGAMR